MTLLQKAKSSRDETDSFEELRQVREQRSPPEPNSSEAKVKVSVRHCTLSAECLTLKEACKAFMIGLVPFPKHPNIFF